MLAARDAELSSAACSTGQHFSLVQRQLLQRPSSAAQSSSVMLCAQAGEAGYEDAAWWVMLC